MAGNERPSSGLFFDLQEQAALRLARIGRQASIDLLWERVVDPLWSITIAMIPEDDAIKLLSEIHEDSGRLIQNIATQYNWKEVFFEALWSALWRKLELPVFSSIDIKTWGEPPVIIATSINWRDPTLHSAMLKMIRSSPPELQMIHLFSVIADLHAETLARFAGGVDQNLIRWGREIMGWKLMQVGAGRGV